MESKVKYELLKEMNKNYNHSNVDWEKEISNLMDCTEALKSDDPTVVA